MIRELEPQYNAEYIANYFWSKEIAKVSSITIIPYILNDKILGIAYIEFDFFCETEAAKDFIWHMTGVEAFIIAHAEPVEDNIWVLEPNLHNEGNLCVGEFTTHFAADFFNQYENADDYLCSEDELCDKYPIKGSHNNRYTVDEAMSYLWVLNLQWEQETDLEKKDQIARELYQLDIATQFYLVTEFNDFNPETIEYSEELNAVFSELREAEWSEFITLQTSNTPPARETNDMHFHSGATYIPTLYDDEGSLSPLTPDSIRREVAMSVDEYNIIHSN